MAHLEVIDEHVEKMLEQGLVESMPSSEWASNVVLVRKSDGTLRFCVDYRKLNDITRGNFWPLPRIDSCLDALGGNKYFSTCDLRAAYHQVEMASKEDMEKTSFVTRRGVWAFRVLPFGLSGAAPLFQRCMDLALAGLTWEICLAFLDDVIIFSKTFDQHVERLTAVFKRLREAGLKLSPGKCHLFQERVKFLGSYISAAGIEVDPEKVEAVQNWAVPSGASQLLQAPHSPFRRHRAADT